ncbi:MAG: hypothetical protein PUF36_10565 [Prevotella sp.]|nr:hypothetical protein [Prevotella sp.]
MKNGNQHFSMSLLLRKRIRISYPSSSYSSFFILHSSFKSRITG